MKVVVTGATGHVGRYLVDQLVRSGHQVVAASPSGAIPEPPFEHAAPDGDVRGLALDLTSDSAIDLLRSELGSGSALVHLAALPPPGDDDVVEQRRRLLEVNVLGTLRVLDAARSANGKPNAVVYASCAEVYGDAASGDSLTESSPVRPANEYAATKLAGEDHLAAFGIEEDVRVVSLRFAAIYGAGRRRPGALDSQLEAALGAQADVADIATIAGDRVHARDAAFGIELALGGSGAGVYNLSDGSPRGFLNLDKARGELRYEPKVALRDGLREQLRWLETRKSVSRG